MRARGHTLLREDADFHEFQICEAGVRQYRLAGWPLGEHIHAPTVRAVGRTYDIAVRLQRGDALHAVPG